MDFLFPAPRNKFLNRFSQIAGNRVSCKKKAVGAATQQEVIVRKGISDKIILLALAMGALFVMPILTASQAHAVDIFIKKNKEESPAVGENSPPRVFTTPKKAPSEVPPARVQQKPAQFAPSQLAKTDLPHSTRAKAVCSPEDARKILAIDTRISKDKKVPEGEESPFSIRLNTAGEVTEVINLYLRCGAYLRQYKEAADKAPGARPARPAVKR